MPLSPFVFHPTITLLRRAQLVLAIMVYLYAALASGPNIPSNYPDWMLHLIGNILLFGSVWTATVKQWRIRTQLCITLPFSLIIEFSQMFSQGRQVDPRDMLVNFIGLGAAATLCWGIEKIWLKRHVL